MTTAVKKIKAWLSENDRTEAWLARQLNTSPQAVRTWLTLGNTPKTEIRVKLKEMFGLEDDWV